jgi:hypothetical protein
VAEVEVATATSIVIWIQFLGMSTMISAAQAIFLALVKTNFQKHLPQLDAAEAIRAGATAYIDSAPADLRASVVKVYSDAIAGTNYLGLALAAASVVASIGVWNTKVGGKAEARREPTEATEAASKDA